MTRLLLVPAAVLLACAADWPRFRGPNGTGTADDKGLPVAFDAGTVLWKTRLPGRGNSSPCVVAGRAYLQTATPDGSERSLVCVDAAGGAVLWAKSVPGKPAKTHAKNSLASSTPACDGERVYALFWDGSDLTLVAFGLSGEQLWSAPLGPHTSQHGAGTSPVVVGGLVVVANDQDNDAVLVAFDARTGKEAWKTPRKPSEAASYSTPFLRETPDGPELVAASTAGLGGYDPKTGAKRWEWDWKWDRGPLRMVSSPVAAGGVIVGTTGNGAGNSDVAAVRPGPRPELAWRKNKGWPYVPCLLATKDHLFTLTDRGIAGCAEPATGKELWSERLASEGFTASPVLVNGVVYAVGEKGGVYAFAADPAKFRLLGKGSVGEEVYASPAVAGGKLYVRGRDHLFCLGKR